MQQKFKELTEKYPNLSSAMVFVKLIKGKGYTKSIIRKWFKILVDESDYLKMEKESVLKWLYEIGLK